VRQVVVITGASGGIGRATARRFGRRGAAIGLLARGKERLQATADEVRQAGGEALALPLDVADHDAVDAAAAQVESELGPIDVWVNNAVATVFAPIDEITPDEFRRTTEVTYHGFVWGTLAALRRMKSRDRGTIVQVGSALAYRSIPLQAPYCAAKHAVEGFTESLRTELLHAGSNVRVTMVQLPAHNTPQFSWSRAKMPRHPQPVPPIFQPEIAAEAIEHAALHPRREIWVGWPTVKAIVGNRLAPWLGDRLLARSGFESQQTDELLDGDRPGNLFEPVGANLGAHGIFDEQARTHSWLWSANARRPWLGLAAGAASAAVGAVLTIRTRSDERGREA
jgi:NAD(P)-dependent dehydrogenase (short-subunit alcohol dehydrogenase family)